MAIKSSVGKLHPEVSALKVRALHRERKADRVPEFLQIRRLYPSVRYGGLRTLIGERLDLSNASTANIIKEEDKFFRMLSDAAKCLEIDILRLIHIFEALRQTYRYIQRVGPLDKIDVLQAADRAGVQPEEIVQLMEKLWPSYEQDEIIEMLYYPEASDSESCQGLVRKITLGTDHIESVVLDIEYDECDYHMSFSKEDHNVLYDLTQEIGMHANKIVSATITTNDEGHVTNVFEYNYNSQHLFCDMLMLVTNLMKRNQEIGEEE